MELSNLAYNSSHQPALHPASFSSLEHVALCQLRADAHAGMVQDTTVHALKCHVANEPVALDDQYKTKNRNHDARMAKVQANKPTVFINSAFHKIPWCCFSMAIRVLV